MGESEKKVKELNEVKKNNQTIIAELKEMLAKERQARIEQEKMTKSNQKAIAYLKEMLNQEVQQKEGLQEQLDKRNMDIQAANAEFEELSDVNDVISKRGKELENQVEELAADLNEERERREKAEKAKKEPTAELDSLRLELEDSLEELVAATETLNKLTLAEQEVTQLKKELEASMESHEQALREMRRGHSQILEDLNDQLDQAKRGKSTAEKAQSSLKAENSDLSNQIHEISEEGKDWERKRKQLEQDLQACKNQIEERNHAVRNAKSEEAAKL